MGFRNFQNVQFFDFFVIYEHKFGQNNYFRCKGWPKNRDGEWRNNIFLDRVTKMILKSFGRYSYTSVTEYVAPADIDMPSFSWLAFMSLVSSLCCFGQRVYNHCSMILSCVFKLEVKIILLFNNHLLESMFIKS